ncbi:hypothetical protein X777_15924, partial [Ooceraea biroi]
GLIHAPYPLPVSFCSLLVRGAQEKPEKRARRADETGAKPASASARGCRACRSQKKEKKEGTPPRKRDRRIKGLREPSAE